MNPENSPSATAAPSSARTSRTSWTRAVAVASVLALIALGHIGAAKVRRATSDSAKFQTATIWIGLSLAAVAGFIPWTTRPFFPSF